MLEFDEAAYLEANPDVKAAVASGAIPDGRFHYERFGKDEGRPTTTRRSKLMQHITKEMSGIEIGPYYAPFAPKRDGYNCLSFDVFDTDTLRRKAAENASIADDLIDEIEEVDIVGTASDIASAVGDRQFDYVLTSHNLEHLPDPIRFLQGVEKILKPNGVLSIALPNCQYTFDFFRWPTQTHEWIEAFREERKRPTIGQIFAELSLQADPTSDWADPILKGTLADAYGFWKGNEKSTVYDDVHCSIFTPSSFELLILELNEMGMSSLVRQGPFAFGNNEFFVHLTKRAAPQIWSTEDRKRLMLKVMSEVADKSLSLKSTKLRVSW